MRRTSMTGRQPAAMASMGHIGGGSLLLPSVLAGLVIGDAPLAARPALRPACLFVMSAGMADMVAAVHP